MESFLAIGIVTTISLFLITWGTAAIYRFKVLNYLRNEHPETHLALGKPAYIGSPPDVRKQYAQFFTNRTYLDLNDDKLNNLVHKYRVTLRISVIFFVLTFGFLFSIWAWR
jgi:hypothetical protein